MNKSSRGTQGYHVPPLDLSSRYIRPHSSTAHLISQIYSEEKLKASKQKQRSKSLSTTQLNRSKSTPGNKTAAGANICSSVCIIVLKLSSSLFCVEISGSEESLTDRGPTVIRAEPQSDDEAAQQRAQGRPDSRGGNRPDSRGGNRPLSGGLQRSAFRSDQSDTSKKKSPQVLTKMATFSMGSDGKDTKDRPRPEILPKSKSTVESRHQQVLQQEEEAARKIEEKRLRVKERQLALENRERQILWLQMIVHLSRSA